MNASFQCWKCGGLIFSRLCRRCGALNAAAILSTASPAGECEVKL